MRSLLRITNLKAGYDNLEVLHGIDMSVREGDLAVVIGPNGSGKSTVVKSVFHLTQLQGSILFDGKELTRLPTHEIVRLGIGYVPQGRLVFDSLTVEENLGMGGYGLKPEAMHAGMARVLKLFPQLKTRSGVQAGFLSGGQQQMLSIARALMRTPRLLLLDEPSLGLDPKTQQLIFRIVRRLRDEGVTVLMVEQNAHQALRICDKAYVLENGGVAAAGGKDLAKRKKIQELYLGG